MKNEYTGSKISLALSYPHAHYGTSPTVQIAYEYNGSGLRTHDDDVHARMCVCLCACVPMCARASCAYVCT